MTARNTIQADVMRAKPFEAGSNDRIYITIWIHQWIKDTLGITGLSGKRVHIDFRVWHLDVGSSCPVAAEGYEG